MVFQRQGKFAAVAGGQHFLHCPQPRGGWCVIYRALALDALRLYVRQDFAEQFGDAGEGQLGLRRAKEAEVAHGQGGKVAAQLHQEAQRGAGIVVGNECVEAQGGATVGAAGFHAPRILGPSTLGALQSLRFICPSM